MKLASDPENNFTNLFIYCFVFGVSIKGITFSIGKHKRGSQQTIRRVMVKHIQNLI